MVPGGEGSVKETGLCPLRMAKDAQNGSQKKFQSSGDPVFLTGQA
jgi:hypothetical protein